MNSTLVDDKYDNIIAMICVSTVSVFGLATNGLSFYITRTSPRFRNAFGLLCSGYLLCNLQAIIVLFAWTTIVLSENIPNLSSSSQFLVRLPAMLACGAWHAAALLHFFVTLNRLCAFVFPVRYNIFWSERNAFIIVIFSWSIMMLINAVYLFGDCSLIFNSSYTYVWKFPATLCGTIVAHLDGAITITLVVAMSCIDFISLVKLFIYRRAMSTNFIHVSTRGQIKELDVLFFKQTCICAFLYITADLVGKASRYFTNKWITFGTSTITWILTYSLDGMKLTSEKQDDSIAMLCISVVSVFGLATNGLSFYITRTSPRFRNAFGLLCSGYLLCNLQAIIVLFTWTTVVLSTSIPSFSSPSRFLARLPAMLACAAWHASALLHFFVALNRFCVFAFPLRYNMLWSEKNALVIVIFSWSLTMLLNTVYLVENCSLTFNPLSTYTWEFSQTLCGEVVAYLDGAITIVSVVAMACVDCVSLVKLIIHRRARRNNTSTYDPIKELDVIFFKQTCICALLYITAELIGKTSGYFANKWVTFGLGAITWIITHSLDGLILLLYNRHVICVKIGSS